MAYDDDFDDELDLGRYRGGFDRPHAGAGVTAAVMGIVALVGGICTVIAILVLDSAQPAPGPDDDVWMGLLALALLGCGTLSVAGFVLGLAGSFQSDRNPLFGIVGVVVNALAIIGMGIVVCLGVLSDM